MVDYHGSLQFRLPHFAHTHAAVLPPLTAGERLGWFHAALCGLLVENQFGQFFFFVPQCDNWNKTYNIDFVQPLLFRIIFIAFFAGHGVELTNHAASSQGGAYYLCDFERSCTSGMGAG